MWLPQYSTVLHSNVPDRPGCRWTAKPRLNLASFADDLDGATGFRWISYETQYQSYCHTATVLFCTVLSWVQVDGKPRLNLASFVTTWMEPRGRAADAAEPGEERNRPCSTRPDAHIQVRYRTLHLAVLYCLPYQHFDAAHDSTARTAEVGPGWPLYTVEECQSTENGPDVITNGTNLSRYCPVLHVLYCPVLHVLYCPVLHVLYCPVLHVLYCPVLHVLYCPVLHVLYCPVLHVLYCPVLHVLYCPVLHVLYCPVLHVLYCPVLHVLYCPVLHVLYCPVLHVLYCPVLHVLYCPATFTCLYCPVLHVLYCPVLHVLYCPVLHVLYCPVLHVLYCPVLHVSH